MPPYMVGVLDEDDLADRRDLAREQRQHDCHVWGHDDCNACNLYWLEEGPHGAQDA